MIYLFGQLRPALRSLLHLTLIVAAFGVAGCATPVPQALRQSLTVVVPHDVDFEEMKFYGERAKATYGTPSEIRREIPNVTRVRTVKSVNVQYFVATNRAANTQLVAVRGTQNKQNWSQDIAITLVKSSALGIRVHKGFDQDARAVFADIKPHLRKDYDIQVTGHSLGGAVGLLLAAYLLEDEYNVTRIITFGQPKVTNEEGAQTYEAVRTTRVVHDDDVVPMVPPTRPTQAFLGGYEHVGQEVILRPGRDYVYLSRHDADRLSVGELWRSIGHFSVKEHFMEEYLANIQTKIDETPRQVPYYSTKTRVVEKPGVITTEQPRAQPSS